MQKIQLPCISERIRGFTLPEDGVFYVFDYDEMFKISLNPSPSVEVTDENPYSFEAGHPGYFGVSDREPILNQGGRSVSYNFDPKRDFQAVLIRAGSNEDKISFQTFSGDWFVATLTPDAAYLLVAEPYLIEVYVL
ncbi:hypothetical protein [Acinetobacter junii]|uniref:hypothetical protein n=1 Tax=Acinetobacter junii TaxID=40215 RepID=UPI00384C1E0B